MFLEVEELPIIRSLEDLKVLFGRRLCVARERRGFTQKALGALIELDPNSLARIERGEQGVRWANLERMIKILGFPASFYFQENDAELPTPEQALEALSEFVKQHAKP